MAVFTEIAQQQVELKLKDQVAVVSGAASGIGRAAAITLAKQGANVCLIDLKEQEANKVKSEIEALGKGKVIVTQADVSEPKKLQEAINQAFQSWGRLDIVFANAGINGTLAPIESMPEEEWDHTLSTNLRGTFLAVKYAIPHMKQSGGSIIITSSINGNRTFSNIGMSAYSTSKAAQTAFMKMAALELARYKIRVNAICPGAIQTNIKQSSQPTPDLQQVQIPVHYPEGSQPLDHQPGTPEQVADLVLFLASSQASHITGTEIYIDGAESLL